jgi:general secretion pathway protein M
MIGSWWQNLQTRERNMLSIGTVVIVAMLLWAFAWYPLSRARADLAKTVAAQRDDLAHMHAASVDITDLRARATRGGADRQGKSLLALADVTARDEKSGLGNTLKRVEPVGPKSVRVSFESASFDALMSWVDGLGRSYGVVATDLSADRAEGAGIVNARVTLEDP